MFAAPTRCRSTLLCSGIAELRARGHFENYAAALEPAARDEILTMIAGVWMPMRIAMAHFQAVETLGLSDEEAFDIGGSSGRRIHATLLHTLIRLATSAGASPWTVFQNYGRMWARIFDGGRIVITRVAPKDALVEISCCPPARFHYYRNAFRGANHSGLALFARTVFVRELPSRRGHDEFALRVSWA
ncbi:MAG: hypothetical protein NVS3B10_17820 [Polyangiales bacterium]